jgi:hypothetical protein
MRRICLRINVGFCTHNANEGSELAPDDRSDPR